jgi:hypothetical protein
MNGTFDTITLRFAEKHIPFIGRTRVEQDPDLHLKQFTKPLERTVEQELVGKIR